MLKINICKKCGGQWGTDTGNARTCQTHVPRPLRTWPGVLHQNSGWSFTWNFFTCLIQLVVFYDATLLPFLETPALRISPLFPIMVKRAKYLYAKDAWSSQTAKLLLYYQFTDAGCLMLPCSLFCQISHEWMMSVSDPILQRTVLLVWTFWLAHINFIIKF